MAEVKNENYILIPGWAVRLLNLKGTELLVFSIIHGFSQDGEHSYHGSRQYLADWTNTDVRTIQRALDSLVAKGIISKQSNYVNGVTFCEYRINDTRGDKMSQGSDKMSLHEGQNVTGGRDKMSLNNIDNNNINKNKNNNIGRFTPPTVEEVQEYCQLRNNNVDANKFVDYYTSNGWKVGKNTMKDWKASVRTWERNEYGSARGSSKPSEKGVVPEEGYAAEWLAQMEAYGL